MASGRWGSRIGYMPLVVFGVIGSVMLCTYWLRKRAEKQARAALLFDPVVHAQRRELEMRAIVSAHPI